MPYNGNITGASGLFEQLDGCNLSCWMLTPPDRMQLYLQIEVPDGPDLVALFTSVWFVDMPLNVQNARVRVVPANSLGEMNTMLSKWYVKDVVCIYTASSTYYVCAQRLVVTNAQDEQEAKLAHSNVVLDWYQALGIDLHNEWT
ncbi:MAG: hypothetical protein ACLQVD_00095 [Capsulimonadaceae bacterium]